MTLREYMASDDPNAYWRLPDGARLNLLDEAIEIVENARRVRECFDAEDANGLLRAHDELAEALDVSFLSRENPNPNTEDSS
jgi:hypothetical protein